MQRNHIAVAALAAALTLGAASTGYVLAESTSAAGYEYAGQHQGAGASPAAPPSPGASVAPAAPASPAGRSVFSDPTLGHFIAQQAGAGLAGRAPQVVAASQVRALSEQRPAGASVDSQSKTIDFYTAQVSFTVVAIAPGAPDMTFTVAGLANPTIIVPAGARVTVQFINNDTNEAHGWLVTAHQPPFEFGQPASPAIPGADAGVIGNPTAAGDGASTRTFTASAVGSYHYICPMPGHAQLGMAGSFIVH